MVRDLSESDGLGRQSEQNGNPVIGVLFPNLEEAHYSEEFWGVADFAQEHGSSVVCFAGGRLRSPVEYRSQRTAIYDLISADQVDGLIIWDSALGLYVSPDEIVRFCQQYHPLPVISLSGKIPGLCSVTANDEQGIHDAIAHLVDAHGCRRFTFIPGQGHHHSGDMARYRAFMDTLEALGLPREQCLRVQWMQEGDSILSRSAEELYTRYWHTVLQMVVDRDPRRPDAIIATNDLAASYILQTLQARGVRVPDDVALTGFDDKQGIADVTSPTLTTVRIPFYQAGQEAARLVLEQIQGVPCSEQVQVPTQLVVRQSCGCLEPAVMHASGPITAHDAAAEKPTSEHRETTISAMVEAIGNVEGSYDWTSQIVDAFTSDLSGAMPGTFVAAMREVLRQVTDAGGQAWLWQDALSALRRRILPALHDRSRLVAAESLLGQARTLIGETVQRIQRSEQMHTEQYAQKLRQLGQQLISTFDVAELMGVLAEGLPSLGIPGAYVSVYEQEPEPIGDGPVGGFTPSAPTWSRRILAADDCAHRAMGSGETRHLSRDLMPERSLSQDPLRCLVMEPLYFREEQTGFVLFRTGPRDGRVYEILSRELSSALQGALLVQRQRELIAEAQDARQAAEEASRAKSVFLANISHELRTPLNAILGFSQLMLQGSPLTADQHSHLTTINRSGEHLLALVNDVLELSKIEAGRLELHHTDFDLYYLLLGLEEMFRLRAENKGLDLIVDRAAAVPQYIHADEDKLRQVLINLLGNAVKFTEQGRVVLRIENRDPYDQADSTEEKPLSSPAPHQILLFAVSDTGSGIAPDEMGAVFAPFIQTASGRSSREGTGLGLPISHQYVQAMGGELTVRSEIGRGSVFQFDLPVQAVDASRIQVVQPARRVVGMEPEQRDVYGDLYRLLIVEDIDANRELLSQLLDRLADVQVRHAANGQEAIAIWEQWNPHLIWMDMRMPMMDGYEATGQIKARAETNGRQAIIIALTASAFEEDRETILAVGCDDFVRKPFRENEIFDMLHRHLGIRFVYEDVTPVPDAGQSLSAEHLCAAAETLPAAWARELHQAITALDAERMQVLIDSVRPQAPDLADTLAQWVRNFEYEKLMDLVAPET